MLLRKIERKKLLGISKQKKERWQELLWRKDGEFYLAAEKKYAALLHKKEINFESRIFGLKRFHIDIALESDESDDFETLLNEIHKILPDNGHISIRIPAGIASMIIEFQKKGWFFADQSVEYSFEHSPEVFPAQFTISSPRTDEIKILSDLTGKLLSDSRFIRTRFTTDPMLLPQAHLFYKEWAERTLRRCKDGIALVARNHLNKPLGMITAHIERMCGFTIGRIELNAVIPEYRSQGVYSYMLAEMLKKLFEKGAKEVVIRTSASTISVQRVWNRFDGSPTKSDVIFHRHPFRKKVYE